MHSKLTAKPFDDIQRDLIVNLTVETKYDMSLTYVLIAVAL